MVVHLEERVAAIAVRGIRPADRETYPNGVRKVIYRAPDGKEIGVGGGPVGRGDRPLAIPGGGS